MAIETVVAEQYLQAVLAGREDLVDALAEGEDGIWLDSIPREAALPAVLIGFLSGSDYTLVGDRRLYSELVYVVRGVAAGISFADLTTIAAEIDVGLHGGSGVTEDGVVVYVKRLRPFRLAESQPDGEFRHLGGVYRLYAYAV